MIDRPKVGDHAQTPRQRPCHQKGKAPLSNPKFLRRSAEDEEGDHPRHRISEEGFLHGGKISRQPDKKGHEREKERIYDDQQDADRLGTVFFERQMVLLLFFVCGKLFGRIRIRSIKPGQGMCDPFRAYLILTLFYKGIGL